MLLSCLVRMSSLASVAGEVRGIRGEIFHSSRPGISIFFQLLMQGRRRRIARATKFAKQPEKSLLNFG